MSNDTICGSCGEPIYAPETFWDRVRDLPWTVINIVLAFILVFGGLALGIYMTIDAYRSECHGVGGHIVTVRDEEVCVDRDGKVIFL